MFQLELAAQTDSTVVLPIQEVHVGELDKVFISETQGVFCIMPNGIIKQYDFNAKLKTEHFFESPLNDYQIDANNTFNILIFDKDFNVATFTDRWFRPLSEVRLESKYKLACMAKTGELWLYNEIDHSIVKYNTTLEQTTVAITLQESLPRNEKILSIKELGDLLAIRTDKSLYLSSITGNSISSISIDKNQLMYLTSNHFWKIEKGNLRKINIYTREITEYRLLLPEHSETKNLMVSLSGLTTIIATRDKLYFYKLPKSFTY